jgi:S-adenosyl methyltransferase
VLGGKDNYPIDREVGEQVRALVPEVVDAARAQRGFLVAPSVTWSAMQGSASSLTSATTPEGATDYVYADLRNPDTILREAARTLDFTRPIAFMLLGIVEHILDTDEAHAIVNQLLKALPSGSYLVLCDPTTEVRREVVLEAIRRWNESATPLIVPRSRQELIHFFDGLELLEPGVVPSSLWRPEASELGTPVEVFNFDGVGRKP